MWSDELARACRRHPDVVAVYEAPDGTLALLLRQTLLPLPGERGRWFNETRRAARAAVAGLRAGGAAGAITVLQWRPLEDVGRVLACWTRRFLGDAGRHAQLLDIVAQRVLDGEAVAPPREEATDGGPTAAAAQALSPGLVAWYHDMAASWLGAEPTIRRLLILRTHRWIVERVLDPMARGERPRVADLGPSGRLVWTLVHLVPAGQLDIWKPWIRLTLADLQRALQWPEARRREAWVRWLFLIPYSVPVTGTRPVDTTARSWDRGGGVA